MDNVKFKKILLLSLPMLFAVALAITLAACMAQANRSIDDSILDLGDTSGEGQSETTSPTGKDPENLSSLSSLDFSSNGNGTCSVSGIGSCVDENVRIPERSPSGDDVVAIADSAFLGCQTLKTITLPESVRSIGAYAFYGSSLEMAVIPSSIESIEECAFANCLKLTAIDVDRGNESYSSLDGVLFSKDKSELICYPSGKSNSSYTVRSSVKKIHKMAFYNCAALKTVNYNGKKADWELIEIGANNDSLTSAEIKFASSNK